MDLLTSLSVVGRAGLQRITSSPPLNMKRFTHSNEMRRIIWRLGCRCAPLPVLIILPVLPPCFGATGQFGASHSGDSGSAVIRGTVTDSATGYALSGATVRIISISRIENGRQQEFSTDVDSGGRFDSHLLPPGHYTITVEAPGFLPGSYPAPVEHSCDPRDIVLKEGGTSAVAIALTPEGVIAGTLKDDVGKPISHATVFALRAVAVMGRREFQVASAGESDESGAYVIGHLGSGMYYVKAMLTRTSALSEPQATLENKVPLDTFYPDSRSVLDAQPVKISQTTRISANVDITLSTGRLFLVRGSFLGPHPNNAELQLFKLPEGLTPMPVATLELSAANEFSYSNASPGTYVLRILDRMSGQILTAAQFEVANTDVLDIVLQSQRPASVQGDIAYGGLRAGIVHGLRIVLLPSDSVDSLASFRLAAVDPESRTFSLANVESGSYRIRLLGLPAGMSIEEVLVGGQTQRGGIIRVLPGAAYLLHVRVMDHLSTIQGRLEKVPDAPTRIVLWPQDIDADTDPENVRIIEVAKETGDFALGAVTPGSYFMIGTIAADADLNVWRNMDLLKAVEKRATVIAVTEMTGVSQTVSRPPLTMAEVQGELDRLGLNRN